MQKREKIIVSLAIIAAIYGAVDMTLSRQKKKTAAIQTQSDSQTIAEIASQLSPLASAANQQIAGLAASINEPGPDQLFVRRRAAFDSDKKIEEPKGPELSNLKDQAEQLIYSGFLAMGSDRIAIINDMDYRIGEQVNGFTITKISQESVQVSQQDAFFDIPASIEPDPALSSAKAPSP